MHSQLSVIVAQSHQYDLQRAAERRNATAAVTRHGRRLAVRSPFKAILNGRRLSAPLAHRPAASR
ncbi:MAG TPA: hypothetical protein VGF70_16100 [Solirubrobacteraceae bacterium]|jgi:hypothetical protein